LEIYCNNEKCKYFNKLEKQVKFNFDNEHYRGFDTSLFCGKCKLESVNIGLGTYESRNLLYYSAPCLECQTDIFVNSVEKYECLAGDCLWNKNKACERKLIFVDNNLLTKEFSCKSYAPQPQKSKINIWRFINSDGSPVGGHIDDDYAERMYQDTLKMKSYPGHTRPGAEPKRKRGVR